MGFEVRALQERPPADVTSVRSLPQVAPDVLLQVSAVSEALATQRAAERLLARVDPQVDLQVSFAAALLAAHVAAVQLQPRVAGHVLRQRRLVLVLFATREATVRALVGFQVRVETLGGLDGPAAHGACDVGVSRMIVKSVIYQAVTGGEVLRTQMAMIVRSS